MALTRKLLFQPTRPLRGATLEFVGLVPNEKFQPTRPLRGATAPGVPDAFLGSISTHAPLAGRDKIGVLCPYCVIWISTHAPLAGRDANAGNWTITDEDFNPRAPCGARLLAHARVFRAHAISTHAPLAGRDVKETLLKFRLSCYFNPRAPCGARPSSTLTITLVTRFQPTRPLRGATIYRRDELRTRERFQPTRPLRGATPACFLRLKQFQNFNPRAPCGARPLSSVLLIILL